jgi:hypothetical protein
VRNNQTLADFNLKPTQLGSPVTFPLKSDQGLDISPEILTSNICVLDGNSVLGIAPGTCTGALKNTGNDKLNAFSTNFKVEITKLSQSIKVNNLSKGLVIKNKVAKLDVTATSKLPVTGNNLTPSVCTFAAGELKIIGNGLCNFELVQPGDSTFSAAPKLTIKLTIANQSVKLNITCIKGKVVKSISGSNPVCPAGFKKK